MKKKFAVAAATAALITMSFSMTVFADDVANADPASTEATTEAKDKIHEVNDPAGNKFAMNTGESDDLGTGFLTFNGKLYYVDADGKYEQVTTGVWGKYGFKDGKIAKDDTYDVALEVGDKTYLLAKTGKLKEEAMSEDTFKYVSANLGKNKEFDYIVTDKGEIVKGWKQIGDNWCYAKPDGTPVRTDWVQTTAGRWYFVDDNGLMVTPKTADGDVTTSKANITTTKVDAKTATVTDSKTGKEYVVNADGLWLNGWVKDGATWKFYSDTKTGWVKYGTKWVYLSTDYTAAQSRIVDTNYAIGSDCYMITGYGEVAAGNVYANEKGLLQSGIQKINGVEYYFPDGFVAVEGTYTVSGRTFYTDATGKIIENQWYKDGDDDWAYVDKSGKPIVNGPAAINGSTYYFQNSKMVTAGVYSYVIENNGDWTLTKKVLPANSLVDATASGKAEKLVVTVVIDNTGRQINNGWANLGNGNWAYAKDGKAYDGWLLYNGSWYYIDCGIMVRNDYVGNYFLDVNGVWTATR